MITYLFRKTGLKKKFSRLYKESKVFRNVINYFGMSAGASAFLLTFGNSCPFCGAAACPVGIGSILIISAVAAAVITFFIKIGKAARNLFKFINRRTRLVSFKK